MIFMNDRLDGGFGDIDNLSILILLEQMSPDERKKAMEDLKKEDLVAFEEFCQDYSEELKKLELLY